MSKKVPRLQFTDEELSEKAVGKAAERAEKKVVKLEKAEAKIPTKAQKVKERVVDAKTGKITTRLSFEEVDKKRPTSKLTHATAHAPLDTVRSHAHRQIREDSDDNAGINAANTLTEDTEATVRVVETVHHSHKEKPYRKAEKAEAAADKANLRALNKEYESEHGYAANPYSKWQQRRAIKKEYAAAKAGQASGSAVHASEVTAKATKSAKKAGEETKNAGAFIAKHRKGILLLAGLAALVLIIVSAFSSCSVLFQGIGSSITSSTYPLADSDMQAAEAQYCAMEAELQQMLDRYEADHDYDEYHFELDEIWHDPYVLISALTALKGGEWTVDEVGDELQMLFDKQYILTEEVVPETRYRTETRTGTRLVTDPDTGESYLVEYDYDVQVPYIYYKCFVTLENFNLSHVPIYIMSEEQLSMYALYMGTLGNRPDLFGDSGYVGKYYDTEYEKYEIPPEALADEQFASMITEAEKYLGFPYVWGGSNPSTSFDCSGFVSWVCNNCGVGWDFGRLGASGLLGICTRVSPANARPGDLIFFQGTYDTTGASHVGIYVGNNMMLHCGDPIHYAPTNTSYWQDHFLAYGRLPTP